MITSLLLSSAMLQSAAALPVADDTDQIEHIVVSATGAARSTLEAPASVSLISREQIENSTEPQFIDLLRQVPGVSLSGRGVGGRKVIQLRGMDSKHSLILVDGRRISATDDIVGHSDLQYDWIALDTIERIEVVRGPLSALYGSEAIGGVINIITRGYSENWRGTFQAAGAIPDSSRGGNQYRTSLSMSGPLTDTLGARFSLSQARQGDTAEKLDPQLSEQEGKKKLSLNTGLSWQFLPQHRLELAYLYADEDRWQDTVKSATNYQSRYDLKRKQFSVHWLPEWENWSGMAGYYRSTFDVINHADNNVTPYVPQFFTDDVFESRFHRDIGTDHRLTVGAEWRNEKLEHPEFINGEGSATHKSALLQDEWRLANQLTLTLGSRWDHHEYFGSEISPRAYLVWELSPGLALKGGYGHGFRAPTLKQISPDYRFDGPHSFIGNSEVKPESSDNWELGLRYEQLPQLTAGITLFHNKVTDLITTFCIDNCSSRLGKVFQYVNMSEASVKGVEAELDWHITTDWRLASSYTYTDSKDDSSGLHLPARPEHRATARLEYTLLSDVLYLSADIDYTGKQWLISSNSEVELPSYSVVNTNLRYRLNAQHQFTFGVSNLNNVDLLEKDSGFGYVETGRSYHLNWLYKFKE